MKTKGSTDRIMAAVAALIFGVVAGACGPLPEPGNDACVPQCDDRSCGPDSCGGQCGTCGVGTTCSAEGACVCIPHCNGAACGDDGCGGSCGQCGLRQVCSGGACVAAPCNPACTAGYDCNAGVCELDTGHLWTAVADRGVVRERNCGGTSWDSFGGLPDPQFCMNVTGQVLCTDQAADTLSPTWTRGTFPGATPGTYLAGVPISYLDIDNTTNDTICSGNVTFTRANFDAGEITITCPCTDGSISGSVHLYLYPQ